MPPDNLMDKQDKRKADVTVPAPEPEVTQPAAPEEVTAPAAVRGRSVKLINRWPQKIVVNVRDAGGEIQSVEIPAMRTVDFNGHETDLGPDVAVKQRQKALSVIPGALSAAPKSKPKRR